ncbi:XRE family transcriptional regulator [Streptococcus anginosus]|uniref:XRE family transcriptional regulator n=1 Tax=Streptococcus anginosus TaxID=1328 RepID=UPI000C7B0864|nr:XRE family transcriptional regulator [Streptococcus anginosus]PLA02632.1 DNA-binding protein [Streptococcus anginosus]PLA06919.1 DNA-binding protein [Streptococcus anginosus]PLA58953.1 DNA-binding protein [Streptococcus anginosus]PLA66662.1 DNA-binding protein [Streptococcus anginosus]
MFSGLRLKQRREFQKLSQTEIASRLEINRSSYNSWESGRAKPNKKNLTALAAILEVPVTYFESEYNIVNNFLQLNDFNKVLAEEYMEDLLQTQREAEHKVIQLFPVEVLDDISLSAGPGQSFDDEYKTRTVYSDEEQYGYDFATWIKGTSMSPTYLDGEVALIRETGFDYNGAVYALVWNDQTYIKKLYKVEDGFRMVSINEVGNPKRFISKDDDFRIVGKVVGHFMPVEEVE